MQIVSGRFKPDEKLPAEALLCEEYAVSRPVLREATRVLVAKGLVYSRPRVGTVVKARREWHLLDPDVLHWVMQSSPQNEFFHLLTSVRAVIEPAVAALAAQHATDAEIESIHEAYLRMEAAPTPEDLLQPDLDFHSRIADATHNDLLAHLCNMLSLALREAQILQQASQPARTGHATPQGDPHRHPEPRRTGRTPRFAGATGRCA